jgi:hypothetical protein
MEIIIKIFLKDLPVTELPLASVTEITNSVTGFPPASTNN